MIFRYLKDPEAETPKLRELGWRVIAYYGLERLRGKLNDPEWNDFLENSKAEAIEKDDPTDFCWGCLIAMGLGGPDVPQEERDESKWAEVMEEWADLAYECGLLRS